MQCRKSFLFLLCLSLLPQALFSGDVSLTLQNGLKGYKGCSDNFILDAEAEANKSTEKTLTAAN